MISSLLLTYGTFMLVSLSGALSPGPLTALALSEGVRVGRWSGARLALGHGLVEIPLVFAVAYGLGTWLRQPVVGGIVGLVGAAVLLWMGYGLTVGAWRGQMALTDAAGGPVPGALRWGHVPGGAFFTLANPYWSLWWATLGAAYVARVTAMNLGPLTVGGLAITHWLTDLLWLGVLSLLVASGRRLISPKAYRAVLLACGVFLLGFGLYFAWSGFHFIWRR
jgi:threonine/homoserine/homoserine lactone efflux protein